MKKVCLFVMGSAFVAVTCLILLPADAIASDATEQPKPFPNEPSIAVDPTNCSRKVIGWRQFNSVTSNFRQAGWGYTSNGGATWTFPGVLENNVFRSDPVLGSTDTGTFFYLSLLTTFF